MTAKLPASAYPTRAAIERAWKAALACGMKPVGFRIAPGGVIEVIDATAKPPENEYEQWRASQSS